MAGRAVARAESGDLQRELDELAAALGRSVSLDSPDGRLLGYSAQGADVDPVRVEAILARRVPEEVQAHQRTHGIDTATAAVRVPANAELGMASRTCVPVLSGRTRLAYIWILDESAPLQAADLRLARDSANRLRKLLHSPVGEPVRTRIDELMTQLAGGTARQDLLERLARADPRVELAPMRIAVIIPVRTAGAERSPHTDKDADLLASARRAVPTIGVSPHPSGVLVLLADPAANAAPCRALYEQLQPLGEVVIGCCDCFTSEGPHVNRDVARAVATAQCAVVDPALPPTLEWGQLGIYRRLLATSNPTRWNARTPVDGEAPSIAMLRRTLEAYLDNGGDIPRTVAELHIHRTTLYYRLERLTAVHAIDLDDGLVRTDLHLALKMQRLHRARERFGWTSRFLATLGLEDT